MPVQSTTPRPERVRAALAAIAEGVTFADLTGRITYSNPAADRILGTRPTDAPPDEWADHFGVFIPGTDEPFPTHEYPLVRALAGEETDGVEMWIWNPSLPHGALITVAGRPIRDEAGQISGAAVIFRDVTALRKAEAERELALERLRELRAQKDELIGFLVHDMKGPLTAIRGAAELLATGQTRDAEKQEDLHSILDGAETLHRMVLDLLDIRTADDGKLEPELTPLAVRTVLKRVGAAAVARGARVTIDAGADTTVMADPELFRRVVSNLVDNCIKYGEAAGRIWLSAEVTDDDQVRVGVRDAGPGVPEDLREAIFEKYARLERDAGRRQAGSRGLGLRLCKVAVEAHGGRIWVEDNEPKGAAFYFELPRAMAGDD